MYSGESGEISVSDHKYKVGQNKRNRPEIPIVCVLKGKKANKKTKKLKYGDLHLEFSESSTKYVFQPISVV